MGHYFYSYFNHTTLSNSGWFLHVNLMRLQYCWNGIVILLKHQPSRDASSVWLGRANQLLLLIIRIMRIKSTYFCDIKTASINNYLLITQILILTTDPYIVCMLTIFRCHTDNIIEIRFMYTYYILKIWYGRHVIEMPREIQYSGHITMALLQYYCNSAQLPPP